MILIPVGAYAQDAASSSAAFPFTDYVKSARTAGMAGLNSSLKTDAGAHFGDIAYASFSEKTASVSVGYGLWQPSVTRANIVSAAGLWNVSGKFAVTAAVSSAVYGTENVYDEYGVLTGRKTPADLIAGAGVSYHIIDCLSVGAAFNWLMSKNPAETMNGFSSDVQLLFRKYGVNLSLAACNLGPKLKSGWALPMNAKLEAGYGLDFGKSHLYGALQGRYYFGGPSAFAAGAAVEYVWNDLIAARGGFHYGSKKNGVPTYGSLGLGAIFCGFGVDVAYNIATGPMKNSFICGVSYSF